MIRHTDDLPATVRLPLTEAGDVIVFDGACILCSGFFRFIVRHDRRQRFSFVIAQSALGTQLYEALDLDPTDFETNLVVVDGRIHRKGHAFIAAMSALGWPWRAATALRAIPPILADPVYDLIARNRYRIFGRSDTCMRPDDDLKDRFIGTGPALAE